MRKIIRYSKGTKRGRVDRMGRKKEGLKNAIKTILHD